MQRKFSVCIESEREEIEAILEIDQRVLDAVTDEWRTVFYNLYTTSEIVEHIAYNILVNEMNLSQLDGWANLPDSFVKVIEVDRFEFELDISVEEYEENS